MAMFSRWTRKRAFEKHGGSLTQKQLERVLRSPRISEEDRRHIEATMDRFSYSKRTDGVSEEEFYEGLVKTAEKNKVSLKTRDIERIKKRL